MANIFKDPPENIYIVNEVKIIIEKQVDHIVSPAGTIPALVQTFEGLLEIKTSKYRFYWYAEDGEMNIYKFEEDKSLHYIQDPIIPFNLELLGIELENNSLVRSSISEEKINSFIDTILLFG